MKSAARPRFDPRALQDLAGDKMFGRGQAYFDGGLVDILGSEPDRVLACVAGTEDYRTVITGTGVAIGGECTCPAFEREGFCKHMVAVALAANATASDSPGGGPLAQVREYLNGRDVDALVDIVMDSAERDPALLRKLELAAAVNSADDSVLESRLRATIRDATRTRGFVDYARAPRWAAGVDAALDMLAGIASGRRAPLAIELADQVMARIERAIESIDDSGGHCGALLARAQHIHLDACQAARPEPVALARDLFRRETQGAYDVFYAAAAHYAEVLGDEGLAEYRRLAQEAWDKLPGRTGPRHSAVGGFDIFPILSILDFFAERDGDVDRRIALRAKDLSSPWTYLQLAEFCLTHGRTEEALRRAEEGLWVFEDGRPDERLVVFTADLLLQAERAADAEAHLWRAFGKAPSMALYGRLRKLGGAGATRRMIDLLRQKLSASSRWDSPADLLVGIMIGEEMFDAAWDLVREHGASRGMEDALARASETTHASEALAVHARRVEELVRTGGKGSYEDAAALIVRMGALRDAAAQAAYLADLRGRHGRKRNFMRLL